MVELKIVAEKCENIRQPEPSAKMKPILFNTQMVDAILQCRKTVTRRLAKKVPEAAYSVYGYNEETNTFGAFCSFQSANSYVDYSVDIKAPFRPGDVLYVRETWFETEDSRIVFKAGRPHKEVWINDYVRVSDNAVKWRPSLHMRKEDARIFLLVEDISLERVQDITEEEAKNEGAVKGVFKKDETGLSHFEKNAESGTFVNGFRNVWDGTMSAKERETYGFSENPWVFAIRFRRISKKEAEDIIAKRSAI